MKTKTFLTIVFLSFCFVTYGQGTSLILTFTAVNNTAYVQLDSIKIMNQTQGSDTTAYWPDTVVTLNYPSGISDGTIPADEMTLSQNYPNPVNGHATVSMYIPEDDRVLITICDMLGKTLLEGTFELDKGQHMFEYVPGNTSVSILRVTWRGQYKSIKVINGKTSRLPKASIRYIGTGGSSPGFKSEKSLKSFPLKDGDRLLLIGYADGVESGILYYTGKKGGGVTFQYATNIPCPDAPTVTYEGQVYNTIQVFSQCWLKENLNVGIMIDANLDMTDNSILEKYCYENEEDNCDIYGGLYQWEEAMQYNLEPGYQGICPPGWHIPTDNEFKVLEGSVDGFYGIGNKEWDKFFKWRGSDVGLNLKATYGWNSGGNGTDLFEFTCLPGGRRRIAGENFYGAGIDGEIWTSNSEDPPANEIFHRSFSTYMVYTFRDADPRKNGFSVRCIKND